MSFSRWAQLRANIFLYCGLAILVGLALAVLGSLPPEAFAIFYCLAMPAVLWSGFPDVRAKIAGDERTQAVEREAWQSVTRPMRSLWCGSRNHWTSHSRHQHLLREVGAVGPDVAKHLQARRQNRQSKSNTSKSQREDGDGEPPQRPTLPLLLTYAEFAEWAGIKRETVANAIASGKLPAPIRTAFGPRLGQQHIDYVLSKPVAAKKVGRPRIA
ncbi:MAG: hypothetical protein JJ714_07330, partial [Acidithiobacillus sp.]|nr:hypothetical protein [Acidithiobacillus sp.]